MSNKKSLKNKKKIKEKDIYNRFGLEILSQSAAKGKFMEFMKNMLEHAQGLHNESFDIDSITWVSGELSAVGVQEKEIKEFIKEIGVAKGLNVLVRLLVGGSGIPYDLFEKYKGTITKRNKIVHEKFRKNDF